MNHSIGTSLFKLSIVFVLALTQVPAHAAEKKNIVLIAGKQSHGPGDHEHNAGVKLLAKCLKAGAPDLVDVKVHLNAEWPAEEEIKSADTILIYADGFTMHPALQGDHLQQLSTEMKRGCGFVTLHWATEVPNGKGEAEFLDWMGGYCDPSWSVNPHWQADFTTLPQHPITSGVHPFSTTDEWYFHMRFREGMASVTPILTAVPPDSTMSRPDGLRSGNPDVRKDVANKVPQHVAWAAERPGGGRGFGFTGGHFHSGWANNDQRKLVLNAILWTAKAAVPPKGVESVVTEEDLKQNLDPKPAIKAPVRTAAATSEAFATLQGSKPRACTATAKEGIVTVVADGQGSEPLLDFRGDTHGPATLKFRARCTKGREGRVAWFTSTADQKYRQGDKDAKPESSTFKLTAGDWQDITVSTAATDAFIALRLFLPVQPQTVEIDWIEAQRTEGKKRWDF